MPIMYEAWIQYAVLYDYLIRFMQAFSHKLCKGCWNPFSQICEPLA